MKTVKFLLLVLHSSYRAYRRTSRRFKSIRHLLYVISMAHPCDGLICHIRKKPCFFQNRHFRPAIFADRSGGHFSSQGPGHQLSSVTDPQYRYSHVEYRRIAVRRRHIIYAVRPTRQDNTLRRHPAYFLRRHSKGPYFAVNTTFSDTPCDQLIILSAEVQD